MTLAGTRPPLISETSLYELHHRARLAIKPGITGMWQVSGRSDIPLVLHSIALQILSQSDRVMIVRYYNEWESTFVRRIRSWLT